MMKDLFSIQILVTLLALRFLFWLTRRHKNIIIRFLMSSLAIALSMFAVHHLLGSYILSNQTSISLQEWRDYTLINSIRNAMFLEISLPIYMLLAKLFEGVF